ncbi:PRDX6 protein, partial [Scytalopus superciliaris]|nr:PRDX6 protein [Scytalopus superciliaris]
AAMPGLLLGDEAPNFEADTTQGRIRFHEFLGDSWGILFSHPRDFTPVCTTELGRAAKLAAEFSKRNVKMIALSIDSVQDHLSWCKVQGWGERAGGAGTAALLLRLEEKPTKNTAQAWNYKSHIPKLKFRAVGQTSAQPLTLSPCAQVFVFGPDKKLKLSILYPATTGRNFDEILRVVDSLQLTAYKKVATPVDWKPGDSVMVVPTLPDEEAKKLFPKGVFTKDLPSGKKYLRYTPQP